MHTDSSGLPVLWDNEFRNWSVNTLVIDPINTNALSQKACLIHAANILCRHCTSRQAWCVHSVIIWVADIFVSSCIGFYLSFISFSYFVCVLVMAGYTYSVCQCMAPPREVHKSWFASWSQDLNLWSLVQVSFVVKFYILALNNSNNSTLLHYIIPSHIFVWSDFQHYIPYQLKPQPMLGFFYYILLPFDSNN